MRLSGLFGDHMVLQQGEELSVWGWAAPAAAVTVSIAGREAKASADGEGRWKATLPPLEAGGPYQLVATNGKERVSVSDVMVGEVWICSGQSNMGWTLEESADAEAEIAACDLPDIRMISLPHRLARVEEEDLAAPWEPASPRVAARFSAVAWHFGRELRAALGRPIGLINTSWGGTRAQAWTSRDGLLADPSLRDLVAEWDNFAATPEEAALERWHKSRDVFLGKLPKDPGNRGLGAGWADPSHDDSDWERIKLPNNWYNVGKRTNGVFWFRLPVDLPASWAGRELRLTTGCLDKNDDSYFNGLRVGGRTWREDPDSWRTPRDYRVPGSAVRAGLNLIALRIMSEYSGGGANGPASAMRLVPAQAAPGEEPIRLDLEWRWRQEADFGPISSPPEPPPFQDPNLPTCLYRSMVSPLLPVATKGVIWYQGESNDDDTARYGAILRALIADWRRRWGKPRLPFHIVQLANYERAAPTRPFDDSRWAEIREIQAEIRELGGIGLALAIDIGDAKDIHPKNKREVGRRLARCALAMDYGFDQPHEGPRFLAAEREGNAMRVTFTRASGLHARGGSPAGLALAGTDGAFHQAEGRIEGDELLVSSPAVPSPVALRYGWEDSPTCNLYNADGFPAEPFRSDTWPVGPTARGGPSPAGAGA